MSWAELSKKRVKQTLPFIFFHFLEFCNFKLFAFDMWKFLFYVPCYDEPDQHKNSFTILRGGREGENWQNFTSYSSFDEAKNSFLFLWKCLEAIFPFLFELKIYIIIASSGTAAAASSSSHIVNREGTKLRRGMLSIPFHSPSSWRRLG